MRNKLFFIIFLTLILTASTVAFLWTHFQYQERISLVDSLLEQEMETLENFLLNRESLPEPGEWKPVMGQALTTDSFDLVMIVQDSGEEKLVFGCPGGGCEDLQSKNPRVATLKRQIVVAGEPLQIELLRRKDPSYLYGADLSLKWVGYTILALGLVFFGASLLTIYLLRPLGRLADYVDQVTAQIRRHIPERVLMDPQLLKARSSHDEFYRIAKAVSSLAERVYQNADLTRQWTAQMAHELKTPLTVLRVEVESLRDRTEGVESEQVDFLLAEIDRLNQVISSFLEWAELESTLSPREIRSIDLASVVERMVERLKHIYPDRELSVVIRQRPRVLAQLLHVEQMVSNLIDNALKYCGSGGVVELGLCSKCFRVTDTGPGLPEEVIKRLGSPFNHSPGSKGPTEGPRSSGLGLAWVYSIARKYGWQLELHSSDQGAVVEVIFAQEESDEYKA